MTLQLRGKGAVHAAVICAVMSTAAAVGSYSAAAQTISLDGGYVARGSEDALFDVAIQGSRGFTFLGDFSGYGGIGPFECDLPRCGPAYELNVSLYSCCSELRGTATLDGAPIRGVGGLDPPDLELRISGSVMLPPLAPFATVNAPIQITGLFRTTPVSPYGPVALSGIGIVILDLVAGTNDWEGRWRVSRAIYEVGPMLPPPLPWTSTAIGSESPGTNARFVSPDTFWVSSLGSDIWGSMDAFRLVAQPMDGHAEISARVISQTSTDPFAKAGVMMRASLDADSPHVILNMTPGGIIEFMTREAAAESTRFVAGARAPSTGTALRVTRDGGTITGWYALDDGDWQEVGSTTTAFSSPLLTGLAVTSHDPALVNHAWFSGVHVSVGPAMTNLLDGGDFERYTPPALGTPGWQSDDPFRQSPSKSETHQPRTGAKNGACWTLTYLDCGMYQELHAPANGTYTLTVYATADRPGGLVGANVNVVLAATANVEPRGFGHYGEPYVVSFDALEGDTIRVWMYSPATPGYVVIDDVSLVLGERHAVTVSDR